MNISLREEAANRRNHAPEVTLEAPEIEMEDKGVKVTVPVTWDWTKGSGNVKARPSASATVECKAPEHGPHVPPYTDIERSVYQKTFRDEVEGQGANRQELMKAVSVAQLTQSDFNLIWELCDIRGAGTLDVEEFTLALHIAAARFKGEAMPVSIPPEWLSFGKRQA